MLGERRAPPPPSRPPPPPNLPPADERHSSSRSSQSPQRPCLRSRRQAPAVQLLLLHLRHTESEAGIPPPGLRLGPRSPNRGPERSPDERPPSPPPLTPSLHMATGCYCRTCHSPWPEAIWRQDGLAAVGADAPCRLPRRSCGWHWCCPCSMREKQEVVTKGGDRRFIATGMCHAHRAAVGHFRQGPRPCLIGPSKRFCPPYHLPDSRVSNDLPSQRPGRRGGGGGRDGVWRERPPFLCVQGGRNANARSEVVSFRLFTARELSRVISAGRRPHPLRTPAHLT